MVLILSSRSRRCAQNFQNLRRISVDLAHTGVLARWDAELGNGAERAVG